LPDNDNRPRLHITNDDDDDDDGRPALTKSVGLWAGRLCATVRLENAVHFA